MELHKLLGNRFVSYLSFSSCEPIFSVCREVSFIKYSKRCNFLRLLLPQFFVSIYVARCALVAEVFTQESEMRYFSV
jgi:hypothetical protein